MIPARAAALTVGGANGILARHNGPVAQLGERYNRTVEVRSSSLLRSTTIALRSHVRREQVEALGLSSKASPSLPEFIA